MNHPHFDTWALTCAHLFYRDPNLEAILIDNALATDRGKFTLVKADHNLQPRERPEADKKPNTFQFSTSSRSRYYRGEILDCTQGEGEWINALPQIYPEKCIWIYWWQYTFKHGLSFPFHSAPPQSTYVRAIPIIFLTVYVRRIVYSETIDVIKSTWKRFETIS